MAKKRKETTVKSAKYAIYVFVCFLAAIFFIANIVITQNQFLYNTICSVLGGEVRVLQEGDPSQYIYYQKGYADKAETLAAANALNEEIVEEGIILLKNNASLPVKTPKSDNTVKSAPRVSVFGKNSVNLVYGGSGSGGASTEGATTLYESLNSAGYETNSALKSFYENKTRSGSGRPTSPTMGTLLAGFSTGETPIASYDSVTESYASDYKDLALIVISRIGGEGYDLPRTMAKAYDAEKDGGGIEKAEKVDGAGDKYDHYLQLDNNERDLINHVKESGFENICVVINSATSMELGELQDDEGIDSIVWIGSVGKTGINALGRVLNGEVNPSGRTVDTYARDFEKDPSWENFGNNNVSNGNRYYVGDKKKAYYYVEYEEGIYVGYRYYETRYVTEGENGDTWYSENVVYPLGYGLSYSEFDWELKNVKVNGEVWDTSEKISLDANTKIDIEVSVTNRSDSPMSGKDVVQLYYTAPYYENEIEKAHVVLADFAKTNLLIPGGASDTVTLSVDAYDMASYDYSDANKNGNKGYELDFGDYQLKIARNAHDQAPIVIEAEVSDTNDIRIAKDPSMGEEAAASVNRFDDVSEHFKDGSATELSRSDWNGTWPTKPTMEEQQVDDSFIDSLKYVANDENQKWTLDTMPQQSKTVLSYNDTEIKLYDLITYENGQVIVDYDDARWETLLDQLTVNQMVQLIGTGNYNTMAIDNIAKPKTTDPDGPVGFTAFMGDPSVYDTCFYASACVLGATYNTDLAYRMGEMIGNEGLIGNEKGDGRTYSGWYAPAVNIHRSPFSGRNWEYYSEDGYLSGIMASGVIQGAKSKGVYTYVKHFALNDQETNRSNNGYLTWATEQTMREIYLKAFELTVKEGETTAMMSSFNRIGKTWAGGSYELLTEVLREEWGFKGMVITDYNYATPYMDVDQMLRAGGDLNLSQSGLPSAEQTATQVTVLRNATKNILYTVVQSNAMNGMGPGVIYRYETPLWVRALLIVDVAVMIGIIIPGVMMARSAKSSKKRSTKS